MLGELWELSIRCLGG